MKLLKVNPIQPEPDKIKIAAEFIQSGKLVAFPTDTVYGLGADAGSPEAVELLFKTKKRPANKPIVLLIADKRQAADWWVQVSEPAKILIKHLWPGPLTLVLEANELVTEALLAGGKSVALRMPDNRVALSLIHEVGRPIATTSANISGGAVATDAEEVKESLGREIDLLLDGGKCPQAQVSTVVDLSGERPVVSRQGAIKTSLIMELLS